MYHLGKMRKKNGDIKMMNQKRKRHRRGRRKKGNWFTRLGRKKQIALCVTGVFLVLIAVIAGYVASKLNKLDIQEFSPEDIIINDLAEEVGEGYTNFVLFGGDSRTGQLEKGVRSDAIIIASLNNQTKEVKMVSVYRDTLLDLTDGSLRKCNSAYSYGGPQQAINMLNMNLDLDIKKYVTVDFGAVAEVVDLLGGIEVDVTYDEMIATNKYIKETASVAGKKANYLTHDGLQTLDGVQATTYARIRKGVGDDYQRTERQRLVIQKVAEKAMKSDLATINSIIDKVFPKISTNFTLTEILMYAKDFAKYKIGESQGFPTDKAGRTLSGKGSCVVPITLYSNVQKLHEFLYGTVDYTPSSKVKSISSAIQYTVGNLTADPTPTTTSSGSGSDSSSGNTNSGSQGGETNQTKPTAPKVDDPSSGTTTVPGGNEGDNGNGETTTPGGNTGDTGTTTPGGNSGDTGTTTPGGNTGDGGTTTPGGNTGDTGTTTPGGSNTGDTGNTGTTPPEGGEGGTTPSEGSAGVTP